MGNLQSKAYVEESACFKTNTNTPEVLYNIFANEDRITDLSYDRLVAIHNLIGQIIKKRQKGEKTWKK